MRSRVFVRREGGCELCVDDEGAFEAKVNERHARDELHASLVLAACVRFARVIGEARWRSDKQCSQSFRCRQWRRNGYVHDVDLASCCKAVIALSHKPVVCAHCPEGQRREDLDGDAAVLPPTHPTPPVLCSHVRVSVRVPGCIVCVCKRQGAISGVCE